MEQLYHTTELIGIKDKNIKILFILKHQTHLEIRALLSCAGVGVKQSGDRLFQLNNWK
ncbi:hypothetical protein HO818_02285 [Streptococcus suis]|nr:hypothetical protein [Streptococcus suis]